MEIVAQIIPLFLVKLEPIHEIALEGVELCVEGVHQCVALAPFGLDKILDISKSNFEYTQELLKFIRVHVYIQNLICPFLKYY